MTKPVELDGERECLECDGHGIMLSDGDKYFIANPRRCHVCLGTGWVKATVEEGK